MKKLFLLTNLCFLFFTTTLIAETENAIRDNITPSIVGDFPENSESNLEIAEQILEPDRTTNGTESSISNKSPSQIIGDYSVIPETDLILSKQSLEPSEKTKSTKSAISDKVIPLSFEDFPERPAPILNIGEQFLKPGEITKGIELPTGAVWRPSLIVWGTLRTALQSVDSNTNKSDSRLTEWSNRFDLFGNLNLTATERILIGFRPLDKNRNFTRYTFEAPKENKDEEGKFEEELNFKPTTFFFEGDFGQIFPFLDRKDQYGLDLAFSVGRQQLTNQDGLLLNDRIDSLGISKINLKHDWAVNHRATIIWGWNELNRNVLATNDKNSSLFGLSNEIDFKLTTAEFDIFYVDGNNISGDGLYSGMGFTQRMFDINSTFRVLNSQGFGIETDNNQNGTLLFAEISKDLEYSQDYIYLNTFYGFDKFRSASRAPEFGGPLGSTGVLFGSLGLGRYGSPLNNQPDDAFGSATGYQLFFNQKRQNIIFEIGGRYARGAIGQRAAAAGVSFQTAVGRRNVLRLDTYTRYGKERLLADNNGKNIPGVGARVEWLLNF